MHFLIIGIITITYGGSLRGATLYGGYLLTPGGRYFRIDYPGAQSTEAWGINTEGFIVGTYYKGAGNRGFVRNPDGTVISLHHPSAPNRTTLTGINDSGLIVGYYSKSSSPFYTGFLTDGRGSFFDLNFPGAFYTLAEDLDVNGNVVGIYSDVEGIRHGYTYDRATGLYSSIDVLNAQETFVFGVNDLGDIAGNAEMPETVPFVRSENGTLTTLASVFFSALDVSNDGSVVGVYLADGIHGRVYNYLTNKPMIVDIFVPSDLQYPGRITADTWALDYNSVHGAVGYYSWTSIVPEPHPVYFTAAGIALLAVKIRMIRRRVRQTSSSPHV